MTLYHLRDESGVEVFTGTITPAPGGGSQTTIIGPFIVLYTDLVNDGDSMTLWTPGDPGMPAVGDYVLNTWLEPSAGAEWNGDTAQVAIGQAVDFYGNTFWMQDLTVNDFKAAGTQLTENGRQEGGDTIQTPMVLLVAGPVQAQIVNGLNNGDPIGASAGAVHIYFQVGSPTSP